MGFIQIIAAEKELLGSCMNNSKYIPRWFTCPGIIASHQFNSAFYPSRLGKWSDNLLAEVERDTVTCVGWQELNDNCSPVRETRRSCGFPSAAIDAPLTVKFASMLCSIGVTTLRQEEAVAVPPLDFLIFSFLCSNLKKIKQNI